VLYELLSGHRAFDGTSKMATLASVMRQEPKRLGELSPGVPRDLEKLVSRCLRKEPERRAQHMSDLKLALEELKEETESEVTSGTSITPVKLGRKRIGWWIAPTCILMLIPAALALLLRRSTPVAPPLKMTTLTSYAGIQRPPGIIARWQAGRILLGWSYGRQLRFVRQAG
jgi:serine/threonine protein kinase